MARNWGDEFSLNLMGQTRTVDDTIATMDDAEGRGCDFLAKRRASVSCSWTRTAYSVVLSKR